MLIQALDAATRTGSAIGRVGEKPHVSAARLKDPQDPQTTAFKNIGYFVRDQWLFGKPDLIVMEAPLPTGAHKGAEAAALLLGLVAVVTFLCHDYGIRLEYVSSQKARKHFIGFSRFTKQHKDEDTRKLIKDHVIKRAQLLGYIPHSSRDDDRADACALWDYAAYQWGKAKPRELMMFGEVP